MSKNKIALPKRKKDSNKGDFGRVLIVAGSEGMMGAGILCSRGSIRSGAGLTYLAVPKRLVRSANLATPEVIVIPHEEIKETKADVIAIGPGLTTSSYALRITNFVLRNAKCPIVVDADALNIISKHKLGIRHSSRAKSRDLPFGIILTPHPGEMSRLTGLTVPYIQSNRTKVAKEYAKKWNAVVVLKGCRTVVASPKGEIYVNGTGNPGLAKGGTGDVLTGVIAAFAGQKMPLFEAARAAVYVHGLSADLAIRTSGEIPLTASDVVDYLPRAIMKAVG